MSLFLDSLWRAAAYCFHWRVIAYSLVPLALMVGLVFGLAWYYWEPAIDSVYATLSSWKLIHAANEWLTSFGFPTLTAFLVPLVVLLLATPVVVVLTLVAVATLTTPAMLRLVASRRFPKLERLRGGTFLSSVAIGLGLTVVALVALFASMPLWLVPPLIMVLPPLIWGWLTYRVMSYDVLAEHASKEERLELIRRHRPFLIAIGVATGYLGAAPSIVFASGAFFIVAAPILIPVAIWIYTLVFAFSALWFAHYGLAALESMRAQVAAAPAPMDGGDDRAGPPSVLPMLPPL